MYLRQNNHPGISGPCLHTCVVCDELKRKRMRRNVLNTRTYFGNNDNRCLIFLSFAPFSFRKDEENENIIMKHLFLWSPFPSPVAKMGKQVHGIHTPRGSSTQYNYFSFFNQKNLVKNTPFPWMGLTCSSSSQSICTQRVVQFDTICQFHLLSFYRIDAHFWCAIPYLAH